jgi:hypothetical protein
LRSSTDRSKPGWPVDVAKALDGSFDSMVQNRAGGSRFSGDCGAYHGMVIGFSTAGPGKVVRFSDRALEPEASGRKGASPATASRCSPRPAPYEPTQERGDGEAVLRFGRDLARWAAERDYFASTYWKDLDAQDLDLGGTAPIHLDLPSAKGVRKPILAVGTNGDAYLLDRDNLRGIGGELVSAHVTPSRAMTSPAVWGAGDGVFVAQVVDGVNCPLKPSRKGPLVLKIRADPRLISTA